jgi:methionyl-tRNA formyltransferase
MARLRIALFGTPSGYSEQALAELGASHEVVAAVIPLQQRPGLLGKLRGFAGLGKGALERGAAVMGVPVIGATAGVDTALAERLRALRPDLICIALYPRLVPAEVAAIANLGAINAHPSLLPRHRGPLPLFWTYHADDRHAGVTVHHASDRFDAGDIIVQEAFGLPRAHPVAELDREVAVRAARLLRAAADALARGTARRTPQDDAVATSAPLLRPGEPMIPFDDWDVERVWHFLAGLCPPYREPLRDDDGREVPYRQVTGYRRTSPGMAPGRLERGARSWTLHCRGGLVELA